MVHFPTRGILILTFLKQFNVEDSKNMRTFRVEWLFTYFQARATVRCINKGKECVYHLLEVYVVHNAKRHCWHGLANSKWKSFALNLTALWATAATQGLYARFSIFRAFACPSTEMQMNFYVLFPQNECQWSVILSVSQLQKPFIIFEHCLNKTKTKYLDIA